MGKERSSRVVRSEVRVVNSRMPAWMEESSSPPDAVRGSMLEEMNKDYLTGAVAKGIPRSHAILKQVLPNSLLAVVTMFGMSIGSLMGGATIVETIFEWKGIGMMAVKAISVQDFPVIQGYVLWMAFIYVFINLIVDLLYEVLDPRIRLTGKGAKR